MRGFFNAHRILDEKPTAMNTVLHAYCVVRDIIIIEEITVKSRHSEEKHKSNILYPKDIL